MEELMQDMGVNAGILEGMDSETAEEKAKEGEMLIYSLEKREFLFLPPTKSWDTNLDVTGMQQLAVACGDTNDEDNFAEDDEGSNYSDEEEDEWDSEGEDEAYGLGMQLDLPFRKKV